MEMRGLEPLTSCMPCKRSSQMSYTPKRFSHNTLNEWFCQGDWRFFSGQSGFSGSAVRLLGSGIRLYCCVTALDLPLQSVPPQLNFSLKGYTVLP